MKQCPQCRQTFADDTHFCLSDGSPLIFADDSPEEITAVLPSLPEELTVIRPVQNIQPPPQTSRQGVSPIFAYLTVGLLLILIGAGAIILAIFVISKIKNSGNDEISQKSNSSTNSQLANKKDFGQNKIAEQNANLRQQQDEIEKEKKRLAVERKKLNDEKTKPTETPLPFPTPPNNYPPQPIARIKFGRGKVAETMSGKVYKERSFVLEARSGQYLSASVGGGCVTFSNGSSNIGYVTSSGDNRLTIVNSCNTEASFSLTVSIK